MYGCFGRIITTFLLIMKRIIHNKKDFAIHCGYIHYNPVRYGLCGKLQEWKYSSVHRFVEEGIHPPNWCQEESPAIPHDIWDKA